MKLLFIIETIRSRGAERVTSVLAEELSRMSHDVYLICTGFVRGEEYPLADQVHLEFIPESRGGHLRLAFLRIHYIRKKIKEIKPDCILSLACPRTLFLITFANIGLSVPMIFSERNDPSRDPKSKIERHLRQISYRASDHIVFQTEGAKNYFSSSIQKKGTIIPNPVKDGLPEIWKGERRPYIVTYCKLVPQKNLPLLLHAFQRIYDEFPEIRLAIYGDGQLRHSLELEAKQLSISDRTEFHPPSLRIHELVYDCALYVSSSDYEGQSNSMLEAMAIGLPCICTDWPSGGARAVIQHGFNGMLIPVGNEEKLADAMRYMLSHPEAASLMGKNAAKIRQEKQAAKIAEKWNQLILKIVSKKDP